MNTLTNLTQQIKQYQFLQVGWNGYNSDIVSNTVINKAVKFLTEIEQHVKYVYHIAPNPDGDEIQIELKNDLKCVDVYICKNKPTTCECYIGEKVYKPTNVEHKFTSNIINWLIRK